MSSIVLGKPVTADYNRAAFDQQEEFGTVKNGESVVGGLTAAQIERHNRKPVKYKRGKV
mgnify:CR=1 FL=1|tara:strand:- start:378 stop:554 length:177 start_codon:yes stop_codon:yes gene_type:complete